MQISLSDKKLQTIFTYKQKTFIIQLHGFICFSQLSFILLRVCCCNFPTNFVFSFVGIRLRSSFLLTVHFLSFKLFCGERNKSEETKSGEYGHCGVPTSTLYASATSFLQYAVFRCRGGKWHPLRFAKIGRFSGIAELRLMSSSQ